MEVNEPKINPPVFNIKSLSPTFLELFKEVVQIHKNEQRKANDFHSKNQDIIY